MIKLIFKYLVGMALIGSLIFAVSHNKINEATYKLEK